MDAFLKLLVRRLHFIHDWSKWEDYTVDVNTGVPNGHGTFSDVFRTSAEQIRQRQHCKKCNKIKVRIPRIHN